MVSRLGSAVLYLTTCVVACGGANGDDDASQGGSAGTTGGAASGGTGAHAGGGSSAGMNDGHAGSTTAAGRGGTSTGGSGGTAAAGGSGAIDCTGTFGTPVPVFTVPGGSLGSLTLGPGDLELIYSLGTAPDQPNGNNSFQHSIRSSRDAAFMPGTPLAELDAGCGDPLLLRTGDLSPDGLRYYFLCYPEDGQGQSAVRLARRASLDAPFVVDATTWGSAYTGITISPDELELIDSNAGYPAVLSSYRRSSVDAMFGAGTPLAGLDMSYTPDLANDNRTLFAAQGTVGANAAHLVVAVRPDPTAAFGAPTTAVVDPDPNLVGLGSAAISEDCRSLYYVQIARPDATGSLTSTIMMAKR